METKALKEGQDVADLVGEIIEKKRTIQDFENNAKKMEQNFKTKIQ